MAAPYDLWLKRGQRHAEMGDSHAWLALCGCAWRGPFGSVSPNSYPYSDSSVLVPSV